MSELDSFTVTVPSRLRLGRRMYPLNLNLYRNAHYIVKAKLKELFAETVRHLLPPVRYDIIEIRYDVWFGSSRRQDVMNVGASSTSSLRTASSQTASYRTTIHITSSTRISGTRGSRRTTRMLTSL